MEVLLVEDDASDLELIQRALVKADCSATITVARSGREAEERLLSGRKPAAMVVLDMRFPQGSGLEFIESVRRHPDWRLCPIVVFSASMGPTEVSEAYERGANCVVEKPCDAFEYVASAITLFEFWCGRAIVPATDRRR